ncbi:MAG: nickel-type superoxide dismutase maturation protease [Acidimicrobiales bacterium]
MTRRRAYPRGQVTKGGHVWWGWAAGVVVSILVSHLTRVEVRGQSMVPTLRPGDRLVAVRGLPIRGGDLVAVADPRLPSRLLVKRVASLGSGHHLDVVGDNPSASTDSRTFGPVPPNLVTGRVVWRYWPPERRGRISGAGCGAGGDPRPSAR